MASSFLSLLHISMCSDIIFLVIFTKGTVWTMVKMIALKCPECGAKLQIEDGHKECFCQYCGHKILLNDGSVETTYTYRKVDEARIKELELEKIKYQENENRKNKKHKIKVSLFMILVGLLLILIGYLTNNMTIGPIGGVLLIFFSTVLFFVIFAD